MRPRVASSMLLVASLAACGSRGGEAAPSPSASSSAVVAAALAGRVEGLARAVLACKVYDVIFDPTCPAARAWNEAKDDFDGGRADPELVSMLRDPDERIRFLAATKLNQYGSRFRTDRALATAVVTAGENEKAKFPAFELGAAVGHVAVQATGTFDRVKAIVKRRDLPEIRRGVLSDLLYDNAKDDAVYDLVRDTVKDADQAVALAALRAFWTGGDSKPEPTCQVYLDNVDNPADDLAAEASNALSWFGRCASRYDALLGSLERRVKAGAASLTSPSYATSARHVCEDVKASDDQRRRAGAVGRGIVGNPDVKAWIRLAALDAVARCDTTDAGRAFIGKYRADPDKSVADKAKELLAKPAAMKP